MEQFDDLEDGLLPIEGIVVEGELPSPILDVDDCALFQLATPSSSGSKYASSGTYSMGSLSEGTSPISVGASQNRIRSWIGPFIVINVQYNAHLSLRINGHSASHAVPWPELQ